MPERTDSCAASKPPRVQGYLMKALGIQVNISRPCSSISSAVVSSSANTSIETPASPTKGETAWTILRYSSICSRMDSPCSAATFFLTSGFLAINDGFVVCPSSKPMNRLMRSVSLASPPSSRILVVRVFMVFLQQSNGECALLVPSIEAGASKQLSAEFVFEARSEPAVLCCTARPLWKPARSARGGTDRVLRQTGDRRHKRLVDVASLPSDAEISPEWDAFITSLSHPASQDRIKTLIKRDFHRPGDV